LQLKGMVAITPQTLLALTVAGYAVLALTMVWVIRKIGAGKNWATFSRSDATATAAGKDPSAFPI
jgi:hypothetical protein